MFKLLAIVVLIQLAESSPQFGFGGGDPKVPGLSQATGLASGAVNTAAIVGGRVAETLTGLIENFGDFRTIFKKNYITEAEERLRSDIFKANLAFIGDYNDLFEQVEETISFGD